MVAMYDYKGHKVTVRESQTPPVAVFQLGSPREAALYNTTSLDLAMKWVDERLVAAATAAGWTLSEGKWTHPEDPEEYFTDLESLLDFADLFPE